METRSTGAELITAATIHRCPALSDMPVRNTDGVSSSDSSLPSSSSCTFRGTAKHNGDETLIGTGKLESAVSIYSYFLPFPTQSIPVASITSDRQSTLD